MAAKDAQEREALLSGEEHGAVEQESMQGQDEARLVTQSIIYLIDAARNLVVFYVKISAREKVI